MANLALSKNKIKNFTEYADDYDNGGQKVYQYHNTNISFRRNVTGVAYNKFYSAKKMGR